MTLLDSPYVTSMCACAFLFMLCGIGRALCHRALRIGAFRPREDEFAENMDGAVDTSKHG